MPIISETVEEIVPDSTIYVVGGAAEGRLTALSDIDIVIVTDKAPKNIEEKARIIAAIRESLESKGIECNYLFEFHIIGPNEAEDFLKSCRKVIKVHAKKPTM